MELINTIGVESPFGFRTIEIYHGDVTAMQEKQDLLVVSAYSDSYVPSEGSLVGDLLRKVEFSLKAEVNRPWLDLREAMSIWVSGKINGQFFKRVLCVEIRGGDFSLKDVFENLFAGVAIMEAKDKKIESMVLPILGTGHQRLSPKAVIKDLLPPAIAALQRSRHLARISFVEKDRAKAEKLDSAVNEFLGRKEIRLPKSDLIESLKKEILGNAAKAHGIRPQTTLFDKISTVFRSSNFRQFEVGILARRLVEFAVDDLIPKKKRSLDLYQKIEFLPNQNIAAWISSYMHVLRIFGNESAHERDLIKRMPKRISEKDFIICLFCMSRILDFWLEVRSEN